jgi:hypothetical protein
VQDSEAKAYILVLCLVSVLLATAAKEPKSEPERVPAIGDKVNKHWDKTKDKLCAIHPSQLDPCFERAFAGVRYTIAYGSENGRVSYIFTDDKNFRTSEKLKVGDAVTFSVKSLLVYPGWLVIGPAASDGWRPVIGFDAEVHLADGTTRDVRTNREGNGTAYVSGFCKDRYFH